MALWSHLNQLELLRDLSGSIESGEPIQKVSYFERNLRPALLNSRSAKDIESRCAAGEGNRP